MSQDIISPRQSTKSKPEIAVPAQSTASKSRRPRFGKRKLSSFVLVVLLLMAVGTAGYFFKQYRDVKKNPSAATIAETESLVKKVGVLITLPKDETPTIATVSDKEKLKDQPFFKDAQKDDKLLIYTNAKQAIIYRPSQNKIINVGPIAINDAQPTDTPKSTPKPKQ